MFLKEDIKKCISVNKILVTEVNCFEKSKMLNQHFHINRSLPSVSCILAWLHL